MAERLETGLIEGFYGHPWSWEERRDWCRFLAQQQQQFYLYAPKSDRYLREQWLDSWPCSTASEIEKLRTCCGDNGLRFGVGLSPFELHLNWNADARKKLEKRLLELKPLELGMIGVLFDDMKGAHDSMAAVQAEIAHIVADKLPDTQVIVCPTYYTPDPILKALFGMEPSRYLEQLGQTLDPSISIFWTGPQVCSKSYPDAHLQGVAERLGRRPFIWDNYPVNDGARMAPFLHLLPPERRPHPAERLISGLGINPMNQPHLSKIPFAAMVAQWSSSEPYSPQAALRIGLEQLEESQLEALLLRDAERFQKEGIGSLGTTPTVLDDWDQGILQSPHFELLTQAEQEALREESAAFARTLPHSLTEAERAVLIGEYSAFDHPAAVEVVQWLRGFYQYQPLSV